MESLGSMAKLSSVARGAQEALPTLDSIWENEAVEEPCEEEGYMSSCASDFSTQAELVVLRGKSDLPAQHF